MRLCDCSLNWDTRIDWYRYLVSKLSLCGERSSSEEQRQDLGNNIGNPIQTVCTSPKIGEQLRIQERKPPVVSRQCVVYQFKSDLCDRDYIGYTIRHLHQRIEEHRATAVGAHVKGCHGISNPELLKQFSVLKKCQGKLYCLIREMLFIRERKQKLNTQSGSIRAKVFVFNTRALIRWLTI